MERKDIPAQYRWRVNDIYESDEAWEEAFAALEKHTDFTQFRGTLKDAESILAYFEADEAFGKAAMRVYLYAYMKHDEDVRDTKYGSYLAKISSLIMATGAETAFVTPELTALPDETLSALIADPRLKDYDYMLSRVRASKKYTLSEREETLLAQAGDALSVSEDVFEMLDNAELDLPEIEYEGKKTRLSHGLYGMIMSGKDREKRKEAYELYYAAYRRILSTLATAYYGNVKKDIFYKTARGYGSCLQMSLFEEDVDESIYKRLVRCVDEATPLMHRYMRLRKKELGLDEMRMYDIYPSMVQTADLRLEYEEAFELVKKSLAPLGEEYLSVFSKAKEEGWIDVYESEGKRNGAYSIGVYGVHPYVMLNYHKSTSEIFTIAHEMGHAMHSYYSTKSRPFPKAEYKIFVAEVASTVNENLLLKYLLRTTEDKDLKKYLLNYFMDMIRTTLFRQTQFAEFEERAHEMAEGGEPLNKDNLSALYLDLNKKYYGDAVVHDDNIAFEWARVPHFYRSFYVYKYATGITSAICIANRILKEGEPAVKDYLEFLKSGSSADPVSLLKIAGADLTTDAPFRAAMAEFEAALDEFESLS